MDYKQALKLVQGSKTKENLMAIKLDYSKRLILPYKDGLAFLSALNNAEKLSSEYGSSPRIEAIDREFIEFTVMSHEEYEQIKIANLLQVTLEEVKQAALQAA
jgi:hypothetical protein